MGRCTEGEMRTCMESYLGGLKETKLEGLVPEILKKMVMAMKEKEILVEGDGNDLCIGRTHIMKFLEYTPLDSINYFLSHVNLGECTLKGNLEAYSCKHTGTDRKLSLSLENEILDYLGQSLESDPPSPADILTSRSSRKTLIYLVLTLNHMYPDYDFSAVQAHRFFKEEGWDAFKQKFDTYMFETAKEWAVINGGSSLLESVVKAIDEVVKVSECEIYSYNPDFEGEPFLERGAIWSFNFFFYNRKLKRIVGFHCCCLSNLTVEGFLADELPSEDDEILFGGMDM